MLAIGVENSWDASFSWRVETVGLGGAVSVSCQLPVYPQLQSCIARLPLVPPLSLLSGESDPLIR